MISFFKRDTAGPFFISRINWVNKTSKKEITKTICDSVNHIRFPNEDHPPDWARRDDKVKKGRSCRIATLTTARHQSISWARSKPFLKNPFQYYPYIIGWQTYHHPVPLSRNLGTLTSWNHLGHSRPVMGLLCLFTSYTCLGLPSGLLPSDFHIKTLYVPFPIRETCPAHFTLLDLITQTKFDEDHEVLPYVLSCIPLLPRPSQAQTYSVILLYEHKHNTNFTKWRLRLPNL